MSGHEKMEATGGPGPEQKERERKGKKGSKENITVQQAKYRNRGNGDRILTNEEVKEDKTGEERYSLSYTFV